MKALCGPCGGDQPVLVHLARRGLVSNHCCLCLGTVRQCSELEPYSQSLYCRIGWLALRLCWGPKGGNPAVWVSPLFFPPVKLSLCVPCNYRPACREGLTTWFCRCSCCAVSLFFFFFFSALLPFSQPPLLLLRKPFRSPAPIIQCLQMVPIGRQLRVFLPSPVWRGPFEVDSNGGCCAWL